MINISHGLLIFLPQIGAFHPKCSTDSRHEVWHAQRPCDRAFAGYVLRLTSPPAASSRRCVLSPSLIPSLPSPHTGGAISLLNAVYLPLHISGLKITYVGYGLPRVGNQAFADYLDAHTALASVAHINNKEDLVPILPGRFLGYRHPSGEIHIQDSGAWLACPGQDNTDARCTVGDVKNIFDGDESDHDGPYNGVTMGC